MNSRFKIIFFCVISLAFISCDQFTKELAKEHLKNHGQFSYYHDTVRLVYVENTGAFLSFGADWPPAISMWFFNILPLAFLSFLFTYVILRSRRISVPVLVSFALVLSGGIGNIIDRILYDRHVTDFLNIGIKNLRTGIFNFADLYVSIGVVLLLGFQLKNSRESGKTSLENSTGP